MVLVERIWKHNGLLAKHPPLNAKAYAAEALGNLRVAGAVGALCHLVLSEEAPDGAYCPVRVWAAADALGKIGDRRAVPALLRLHLLYRSSGAAGDALDKCIDRSTIRTVRVFARRINDQHVRRLLEAIADRKAKELAAGEE
ncbi:MAG: HEAT repeat domain-containing protein [Candidatus Brocadiae bacterium]|nr:HEAT repeat domain-containing protein [Candidatus Brocadiia bacterium]